jgi:hypothetical protein
MEQLSFERFGLEQLAFERFGLTVPLCRRPDTAPQDGDLSFIQTGWGRSCCVAGLLAGAYLIDDR